MGVEAQGPSSSSVPSASLDSEDTSFVEFALSPCGVYHTPFLRSGQETVIKTACFCNNLCSKNMLSVVI